MLLFIRITLNGTRKIEKFQYISCCYLSKYRAWRKEKHTVSIHLMLLFIKTERNWSQRPTTVSIHLMLLFINKIWIRTVVKNGVSIHLMLLFIWEHNDEQDKKLKFQYISCCYLSQIRWCQDICNKGFNTSHVVIYHNCISRIERCLLFQYISCCYLSPAPLVCQECLNTFQYISCCYLSSYLME